jgi:hypothetical protein
MEKAKNNRNQYYMFNNKQPTHHILWQPHASFSGSFLRVGCDLRLPEAVLELSRFPSVGVDGWRKLFMLKVAVLFSSGGGLVAEGSGEPG